MTLDRTKVYWLSGLMKDYQLGETLVLTIEPPREPMMGNMSAIWWGHRMVRQRVIMWVKLKDCQLDFLRVDNWVTQKEHKMVSMKVQKWDYD